MFQNVMLLSMFLLSVSLVVALYRVITGPSMHDRILALDFMGYLVIGIITVLSIMLNSHAYLEAILIIGVLAFLSTIALSKYMEGGEVIERRNDH